MSTEPMDTSDDSATVTSPFFTFPLPDELIREMKAAVIKQMKKNNQRVSIDTMRACFDEVQRRHTAELLKMMGE